MYEFLAHRTPSRSRVFARVRPTDDHLEAVTTLGAADAPVTGDLIAALNTYLATREEKPLRTVLEHVPDAVRIAVQSFVRERCAFELGAFTSEGPIDVIRLCYFRQADHELVHYLDSAYVIGLGVRISNQRDRAGDVDWEVELRSDEAFAPAGADLRTWPLPDGVPVLRTWTSQESAGNPITNAVAVAKKASDGGHWVRLHSVARGDGESEMNSATTSEVVVDVLDAAIPPAPYDD